METINFIVVPTIIFVCRCYALVSTPLMLPNKTADIVVEKCDHGPLVFNVEINKPSASNKWSKFVSKAKLVLTM